VIKSISLKPSECSAQSLCEGANIGPPAHRDKQIADEIVSFNRPEKVMRHKIDILYVEQVSILIIV
jgi:hypothetical protein